MYEIYFDNASTTKPDKSVLQTVYDLGVTYYANPSSLHKKGIEVQEKIIETKKTIAKYLDVSHKEIYFTSGGTEANNTAIFGLANKKIITTLNQHPSITEPIKFLKNTSDIIHIKPINGIIDLAELENAIDEKTDLVCVTHINNETGIINDITKIGKIIKAKNPKTLLHVDGVQGFGKMHISLKHSFVDSYSASSHKIHGLKGLGILYIKKHVNIKPLLYGGLQQSKIRPGTENALSIIALNEAVSNAFDNLDTNYQHVQNLKTKFLKITDTIEDCVINGEPQNTSPYIANISFLGATGEIILNALANSNIFVSTGSACSGKNISDNLINHGYGKKRIDSAVRFSFSKYNTEQEIYNCIEILQEQVKNIRKVVNR